MRVSFQSTEPWAKGIEGRFSVLQDCVSSLMEKEGHNKGVAEWDEVGRTVDCKEIRNSIVN